MDTQGWFERWMRKLPEELIGISFVLYLLSGRWSFARIDSTLGESQPLYEPRFLLVPAMYAVLMFAWRRGGSPQTESTRGIVRVALSLVVFLSYMMCTSLWARDSELASAKFIELLLVMMAVLACVWAWSLCDNELLREAIFRYLFVFCGLLALLGLRSIADARLAVLGGGPNVYGRNMCLLAASCLYFWRSRGRAWLWLPGVALAFVLVILTGSRGALVAFFALISAYVVLARRHLPTTVASLLALLVVTYFAIVDSAVWDAVERTFRSRVIELTLEQRRDAGRGQLFTGALDLSMQQPLFGLSLIHI